MVPLRDFQRVVFILSVVFITENMCDKVANFQVAKTAYFAAIEDAALLGHVAATYAVDSLVECSRKCLSDFRCRSYNYRHTRIPENTCELNDAVRVEYPSHFVESLSYSYYESFAIHNWLKINTDEVCFGAKSRDYGSVLIPIRGTVTTFRLEYLHGYVSCNTARKEVTQSNWGCGNHPDTYKYGFDSLAVFITSSTNQIIAPHNPTWRVEAGGWYSLNGFNTFSANVVMEAGPDYKVEKGEQLRVWYGEDLKDVWTSNNGGRVCLNVYAFFYKQALSLQLEGMGTKLACSCH